MAMMHLAAYDVHEDQRRAQLSALLQAYGDRIQYSVFLLGITPWIGKILELPLDIRHIAFSSANLAYATASHPEGIGVFATLGFMAHVQNVTVGELEGISGPALAFVTFPTVISQMPGGPIFGFLFFASFTLAGLTSFISIIQVVAPAIAEKFGWSNITATFACGLPSAVLSFVLFGTSSGLYDLDVVDAYINNIGVVASAIIMCLGLGLVLRRFKVLQRHLNVVSETRVVGTWWRVMIAVVVPLLLGYMFVQTAWSYAHDGYTYSHGFEAVFGWGMLFVGAVATIVLTVIPWRTPVDQFTPLDLDAHEEVK